MCINSAFLVPDPATYHVGGFNLPSELYTRMNSSLVATVA